MFRPVHFVMRLEVLRLQLHGATLMKKVVRHHKRLVHLPLRTFPPLLSSLRNSLLCSVASPFNGPRCFSSLSSQLQCPGCGCVLQCTDSTAAGYIPPAHFAALQQRSASTLVNNNNNNNNNSDSERESDDKNPVSTMSPLLQIVCQRCHKLKHYNIVLPAPPLTNFSEILSPLSRSPNGPLLIVLLVDLMDVEGTLLSGPFLHQLLRPEEKRPPILLIGNKADLLPSGVHLSRVRDWLIRRAKHHFHFQPLYTLLVSSRTGLNIARNKQTSSSHRNPTSQRKSDPDEADRDEKEADDNDNHGVSGDDDDNDEAIENNNHNDQDNVIDQILRFSHNRNVLVMGVQNVGKSTFINQFLNIARKTLHGQIVGLSPSRPESVSDTDFVDYSMSLTTSHYPGTTLAPLAVPFAQIRHNSTTAATNASKSSSHIQHLYDTPGIPPQIPHFMTLLQRAEGTAEHEEMWKVWKHVQIKKRLKPVVYGLHPGRTLFIGGLARIDYLSGPFAYFTVFTANNIYLHQTNTDHADDVWQRGVKEDKFLVPSLPSTLLMRWRGTNDDSLQAKTLKLLGKGSRNRAFVDIVFPGLGWISVTGVGEMVVKAHFWDSSTIVTREPIMPFESIRGLLPNPRANLKIHKL